jgi:hypothetical protein
VSKFYPWEYEVKRLGAYTTLKAYLRDQNLLTLKDITEMTGLEVTFAANVMGVMVTDGVAIEAGPDMWQAKSS